MTAKFETIVFSGPRFVVHGETSLNIQEGTIARSEIVILANEIERQNRFESVSARVLTTKFVV